MRLLSCLQYRLISLLVLALLALALLPTDLEYVAYSSSDLLHSRKSPTGDAIMIVLYSTS